MIKQNIILAAQIYLKYQGFHNVNIIVNNYETTNAQIDISFNAEAVPEMYAIEILAGLDFPHKPQISISYIDRKDNISKKLEYIHYSHLNEGGFGAMITLLNSVPQNWFSEYWTDIFSGLNDILKVGIADDK